VFLQLLKVDSIFRVRVVLFGWRPDRERERERERERREK
jgi:hypothetical protein